MRVPKAPTSVRFFEEVADKSRGLAHQVDYDASQAVVLHQRLKVAVRERIECQNSARIWRGRGDDRDCNDA